MSDELYGFATGFADSFTRSYSARLANEAQKERDKTLDEQARERDKLRYGLETWKKRQTAYDTKKAADIELRTNAETLISVKGMPADSRARVMELLAIYDPKDLAEMYDQGRLTFSKIEVTEETDAIEPVVVESEGNKDDVDAQTDQLLTGGVSNPENTDLSTGGDNTNVTAVKPDEEVNEDTSTAVDARLDNPLSEVKGLREMLNVDDDYFNEVVAGYTSEVPTFKYNVNINPEVKAATSFEGAALQAAMKDERWSADPANQVSILAEYKGKLSPTISNFDTPKEAALSVMMASSGYTTLANSNKPEDKQAAIDMLAALDEKFDSRSGNLTYTNGNFVADVARYTKMLSSGDQKKVLEATAWFANEKPALEAGFLAVGALTKDSTDTPTFNVMYKGDDGKQFQGLAEKITLKEDGKDVTAYKFADGTVRKGGTIVSVVDEETAKRRQTAVTSASSVYKPVGELQASVVPAVHGLRELDKLALENEMILTAVGGGVSLFGRFGTEFRALMALAGQAETDENITRDTLLTQINEDFDKMIAGNWRGAGKVARSDAEAYKEFSAAMVRVIFQTGKALGQQGNGFSNKDYAVIAGSIQASNSYTAFSRNLRRFSTELLMSWQTKAASAQSDPLVQQALTFPGAEAMIATNIMAPREWYKKMTPEYVGDLDWAAGIVTDKKKELYNVTEEQIQQFNLPEDYLGKNAVVFIGASKPDGKTDIYHELF
tara:strand:- start:5554 stop:7719 length:2166 start_codon:yes stop_codon:yes gene_type:complete